MAKFSVKSLARLDTCHPDIQAVCRELIKQYDFTVLEGYRGKAEQEAAYAAGNSQLHYPASKHNRRPALAVDLAPYPVDWHNLSRFREMLTRFDTVANMLRQRGEIVSEFEYGADWTGLKDYPHIEIKENEHGLDNSTLEGYLGRYWGGRGGGVGYRETDPDTKGR